MNKPRLLAAAVVGGTIIVLASCNLFGPFGIVSLADVEKEVFNRINDHRQALNLAPLEWRDVIADEARGHSRRMADGTVPFGHDGFADRMARIAEVIPLSAAAENIASSGSAKDVVAAWLASPGHKSQIEGDYGMTGVGVAENKSGAGYSFTQIFVKPR